MKILVTGCAGFIGYHTAKKLLNENGVNKIDVITNCTKCDINFYSYRRDGSTENSQISIIKLN